MLYAWDVPGSDPKQNRSSDSWNIFKSGHGQDNLYSGNIAPLFGQNMQLNFYGGFDPITGKPRWEVTGNQTGRDYYFNSGQRALGMNGAQGQTEGGAQAGSSNIEPNYNLESLNTENTTFEQMLRSDSSAFNSLNVDRFATVPAATGGATTGGTATVGSSGGLWEALGGTKGALSGASGLAQGISGYLAAREQNRYNQGNQTGSESRMPYMNEFIRRIVPYLLQNQQSVFENRMREYGVPASSFSNITQLLSGINPNYNGI